MSRYCLWFVFCFVLISLWPSSAKGEDYISKNFPSDEILSKAINEVSKDINQGKKITCTVRFVGRKQNAEGDYVVFYACKDPGYVGGYVREQRLLKLDTNVWVFYRWEDSHISYILQK